MSRRIPGDGPIGSLVLAVLFALATVAFTLRAMTAWETGTRTELLVAVLAALGTISLTVRSFRRARRAPRQAAHR